MASPNPANDADEVSEAKEDISVVCLPTTSPFFYHTNPSPYCLYFPPPPIYFFPKTNLAPPPPSIYVYYPLWCINPNPYYNSFGSIQELPSAYSPIPSLVELELPPRLAKREGLFGRRRRKAMWRKKIQHKADEYNDDHITTVMLRNIPNKYTREMMIEFMDEYCEEANEIKRNHESPISAYDFFYLPIDFRRDMNKGYAFVNFTNAEAVSKFKAACNHKSWSHFSSKKILEIVNARIQGKDELVNRFKGMTYPVEEYGAVTFSPARSGSKNTVQTITVGKCEGSMISV